MTLGARQHHEQSGWRVGPLRHWCLNHFDHAALDARPELVGGVGQAVGDALARLLLGVTLGVGGGKLKVHSAYQNGL